MNHTKISVYLKAYGNISIIKGKNGVKYLMAYSMIFISRMMILLYLKAMGRQNIGMLAFIRHMNILYTGFSTMMNEQTYTKQLEELEKHLISATHIWNNLILSNYDTRIGTQLATAMNDAIIAFEKLKEMEI